jgi:hypothetical protein
MRRDELFLRHIHDKTVCLEQVSADLAYEELLADPVRQRVTSDAASKVSDQPYKQMVEKDTASKNYILRFHPLCRIALREKPEDPWLLEDKEDRYDTCRKGRDDRRDKVVAQRPGFSDLLHCDLFVLIDISPGHESHNRHVHPDIPLLEPLNDENIRRDVPDDARDAQAEKEEDDSVHSFGLSFS